MRSARLRIILLCVILGILVIVGTAEAFHDGMMEALKTRNAPR